MFADVDEQNDTGEPSGMFDQEPQDMFGEEPQDIFGEEPQDFNFEGDNELPDLNGMSPEEMKNTVIEWVQADPENRKSQIMAMLPELSSIIM